MYKSYTQRDTFSILRTGAARRGKKNYHDVGQDIGVKCLTESSRGREKQGTLPPTSFFEEWSNAYGAQGRSILLGRVLPGFKKGTRGTSGLISRADKMNLV